MNKYRLQKLEDRRFPVLDVLTLVIAKNDHQSRTLCKNRLYEFDEEGTWNDVDGVDFTLYETDTYTACVSFKFMETTMFTTDIKEPILIGLWKL